MTQNITGGLKAPQKFQTIFRTYVVAEINLLLITFNNQSVICFYDKVII